MADTIINIVGLLPSQTIYSVRVRNQSTLAILETVTLAYSTDKYVGTVSGAHAGTYVFEILLGTVVDGVGVATIADDVGPYTVFPGSQPSVDLSGLETKAQADTRQTALIAEHDATQTAVASSGGLTTANVSEIVTGVTKVTPRIRDASAGSYSMIAGDTWTQAISLTAPSADKYAVSIKCKASDSDEEAILYADSETGLVTLNGAAATSEEATVSYASGVLTITVSSLATTEIAAGDYLLTAKSLDDGADTSHENNADLTVTRSGVGETSD